MLDDNRFRVADHVVKRLEVRTCVCVHPGCWWSVIHHTCPQLTPQSPPYHQALLALPPSALAKTGHALTEQQALAKAWSDPAVQEGVAAIKTRWGDVAAVIADMDAVRFCLCAGWCIGLAWRGLAGGFGDVVKAGGRVLSSVDRSIDTTTPQKITHPTHAHAHTKHQNRVVVAARRVDSLPNAVGRADGLPGQRAGPAAHSPARGHARADDRSGV